MADQFSIRPELADILRFRPLPFPDPVPSWIFQHLTKEQLASVALVELEMRNEFLEASLKANNQAMQIIKGISK
jgi:hypothetical protein